MSDDLIAKAQAAYDAVSDWPEKRGDPMEVGGAGFLDLLKLRNMVPELIAALSTRAGERERVIEEVLALVDDFKPPQPEASEFAKGANFTARQLWAAIRALASPTTVGGGEK